MVVGPLLQQLPGVERSLQWLSQTRGWQVLLGKGDTASFHPPRAHVYQEEELQQILRGAQHRSGTLVSFIT